MTEGQAGATPLKGHDAGEGWHLGLRRDRVTAGLGLVVGTLLLGGSVVAVGRGHLGGAAVASLAGVAALLAPWWRSHRRIAPHEYEGPLGAGLALPLNPVSWAAIVTFAIVGGLGVAGLVGILAGRASSSNPVALTLGALVSGAIGLFFLLGAYGGVRSRLRRDRCILLTESGIVLAAQRRTTTMPWGAVRAVRPHWTSWRRGWLRSDDVVNNWLSFDADPDRVSGRTALSVMARTSQPTIAAEQLAVDPWLVLAVLRHYLEHDDDRAELRSAAAVDRVVGGRV